MSDYGYPHLSTVKRYWENGNLFEGQYYNTDLEEYERTDEYKDLSSIAFFDTRGRLLQEIYYNKISNEGSVGDESKWTIDDYGEVDTYTLDSFVDIFLNDCKKDGITIKHQKIRIIFEELEGITIAIAYAMNLDNEIFIKVDPSNWQHASIEKKWYIIYHELGHDILNLEHGQGGKMMFNFADREYTFLELFQDKKAMFDYYKNK